MTDERPWFISLVEVSSVGPIALADGWVVPYVGPENASDALVRWRDDPGEPVVTVVRIGRGWARRAARRRIDAIVRELADA